MGQTERIYTIERMVRSTPGVSFDALMTQLSVSRATLKRDLAYLRDRLNAPIEYDRFSGGYHMGPGFRGEEKHELPGVWFSEQEIHALLTMHQLINELDEGGVLSRHLQPLLQKLTGMLGTTETETRELMKRIKIIGSAKRPVSSQYFELIGAAVLKRRRLHMRYLTRGRGEVGERDVSPQRLVHYRNTWYMDAWCHAREKLLRFALDAIESAEALKTKAKEVSLKQVQAEMDGGYGIYAGGKRQWATLAFEPQAAQWVSKEEWHPEQQSKWLAGGVYELTIPFTEETEILMDILRHGDQVRVLAPESLVTAVRSRLLSAVGRY